MDLFLSQDELTHLHVIAQRCEGELAPKVTDRLCAIGMIQPTMSGWQLTPEGVLVIDDAESA